VNKGFNAAIAMRTDWIKSMCAFDQRYLIWKQKANDLFALTADDLSHIQIDPRRPYGFMSYKQVHLMNRQDVLQLALAKHGTFEAINATFLSRKEKRGRRKLQFNRTK
jgi:hypothetical protein